MRHRIPKYLVAKNPHKDARDKSVKARRVAGERCKAAD